MVLHELLGLPEREKHVVSLCGGGGKTTLMYALARETKAILPTALFTTTHIMTPSGADVVLSVPFSAEECRAAWREGEIASSGTFLSEERKVGAPGEHAIRSRCRDASASSDSSCFLCESSSSSSGRRPERLKRRLRCH